MGNPIVDKKDWLHLGTHEFRGKVTGLKIDPSELDITPEDIGAATETDLQTVENTVNGKVAKAGDTMTGPLVFSDPNNRSKAILTKYPSGSGHNNAPTAFDKTSVYLHLGGTEYNTNSYRLIGFGYRRNEDQSHAAAVIGYQETNSGSDDYGKLLFATRNVNSDTAPTVRLTIEPNGDIQAQAGAKFVGDGSGLTGLPAGNVTSANITDASATGRSVLTGASAADIRTTIGAGTSNLTLGTTPTTAKAGDYTPQVSEIKRDTTNPLLTEMASFMSSQDIPTARARYAAFLLIGSGGNNGASTQGARSDHTHAAITGVPTINSAEIPITAGAASVSMIRQNFWCNIVDNTILTLTGIIPNVEYTIDVINNGAVQHTITLAGIPYSGNQDFSIPPSKGAIISIKQMDAARPVRAVISVDPA